MFEVCLFFFFNDPSTTEIYTLSLHDALPIFDHVLAALFVLEAVTPVGFGPLGDRGRVARTGQVDRPIGDGDRKSTRLNSSHGYISYAVFCLKKKKKQINVSH